ncbi:MAG: PH domain-containing protein [Dehalococcoidia bacterium]|nr:PH domain-containing protein [Dehalococcoidia bacterium]
MRGAPPPDGGSLRGELSGGEKVLWEGKPVRWFFQFVGSPAGLFVAAFSLLWFFLGLLLFYTIWIAPPEDEAPHFVIQLLALLFLLAACYFAFGRYLLAAGEWRNTSYLLTDRRVLLSAGAIGKGTTSVDLASLRQIHGMVLAPGLGDIYLGGAPPFKGLVGRVPGWLPSGLQSHIPTLQSVRDVEAVYQAILDAARMARPPQDAGG